MRERGEEESEEIIGRRRRELKIWTPERRGNLYKSVEGEEEEEV